MWSTPKRGWNCEHCDPYGFSMELRPASPPGWPTCGPTGFRITTGSTAAPSPFDRPLNIYELHLGSWKKKGEGETDWYTYEEIADRLIPYILESGYTHIELMPLSEHPGRRLLGLPEHRLFRPHLPLWGRPWQLQRFVDRCHQGGYRGADGFCAGTFRAGRLRACEIRRDLPLRIPPRRCRLQRMGEQEFHPLPGEAASFLNSAAAYWLDLYHMTGCRVDAVSRLLYWQGGRKPR